MRKSVTTCIILFALIVSGLFLGLRAGQSIFSQSKEVFPSGSQVIPPQVITAPQVQVIEPEVPETLTIPKIGVHTSVESVGLDNQGRMDVPTNVDSVAWYNLGFKPGEKGSAVVAGHLDSEAGPAVFWNLTSLQAGDEIGVEDKKGQVYYFKVTRVTTYEFDKVPLEEVFASQDKSRLNLITCGGRFNGVTRNYSHRIVAYSEII